MSPNGEGEDIAQRKSRSGNQPTHHWRKSKLPSAIRASSVLRQKEKEVPTSRTSRSHKNPNDNKEGIKKGLRGCGSRGCVSKETGNQSFHFKEELYRRRKKRSCRKRGSQLKGERMGDAQPMSYSQGHQEERRSFWGEKEKRQGGGEERT